MHGIKTRKDMNMIPHTSNALGITSKPANRPAKVFVKP